MCLRERVQAVCNPGLCENVITSMSKCASVYVSEMAPVKSESGLPAIAQHQMFQSKGQGTSVSAGGSIGNTHDDANNEKNKNKNINPNYYSQKPVPSTKSRPVETYCNG